MSGGAAGVPDFFYKEAQRLGYVARSAFKVQEKYKLIKPGSSVLDLGCAPGAWLQVACQSLGPKKNGGVVVGIDLKNVKVPSSHCDSRVQTVCADVLNLPRDQVRSLSPQETLVRAGRFKNDRETYNNMRHANTVLKDNFAPQVETWRNQALVAILPGYNRSSPLLCTSKEGTRTTDFFFCVLYCELEEKKVPKT
ncbi:Ribosomal RNA large subunit methyltransferase E-like protein [Drosera capensis]